MTVDAAAVACPPFARPFSRAAAKIYCRGAVNVASRVVNSQRGRHRPPDCDADACCCKIETGECTLRCAQPELDSKPQSKASLKPVLTLAPVPLEVFVRVIARWRFLDELAAVRH